MKKLLTLFTLLLTVCSGTWAQTTYRLIDRSGANPVINSTDFKGAVASSNLKDSYGTKTFDETTELAKYVQLGGTTSSTSGLYDANKYIAYDVKTTSTTFKVYVWNGNNSSKNLYYSYIKEGETSEASGRKVTKAITSKEASPSSFEFTVEGTENKTVVFYVGSTNVVFYQIEAVESGTTLKTGGERGYSVNLNKGRLTAATETASLLEGVEYCTSSNYGMINKGAVEISTKGTHYVKFTTTQTTKATITVSSSSTYYIATAKDPESTDIIATNTATSSTTLSAGTYYIVPNGSKVSVTGLAFAIPDAPGEISFSPTGTVEEGAEIELSSAGATTIKYQWGASAVDGEGNWSGATTYDNEHKPVVPEVGSANNILSVWANNDGGDTYGSATYTITGVDTTAPTLTAQSVADNATDVAVAGNITLTFDENVQVADASKVTLTGGEATISSVTAADNVVTIAYTGLANNTTYTLAVASGAITDVAAAQNAYAGTSFSFTTVKASMPAPKINGLGYFIGSQTVSITSDVDGATITYSLDGENYSAYTEPFEITADKTVYAKATHANYAGEGSSQMAMFLISVPSGQQNVAEGTTWDFTDGDDMKSSSDVTNDPVPTSQIVSDVTQYESVDKAAKLSFIKPQRYDDDGYVQAHGFIITSTVPGKLSVNFTNGNSNTRYLIVNGVKKGQISSSGANVTVNDIEIPIGTTIVYGFDVTSNPNAVNNLRYKKIIFTPVTSVSGTITEAGWNTFSSTYPLDLSTITGGTAYVATTKDNENVTLTETTAIVEAGEGLMINGTAGATFTISTTTDAPTLTRDNLLVGLPNGGKVTKNDDNYVFAWSTTDVSTAGFYFVNDAEPTLGAGKAYLHAEGVTPAKLGIIIDDSETDGIRSIENSELRIENSDYYNLAGQKVGKDYKGIVIVNGKKYMNK